MYHIRVSRTTNEMVVRSVQNNIKLTHTTSSMVVRNVQNNIALNHVGRRGPQGPAGESGQGVPTGGTSGQVLTKASSTDFDTSWQDAPETGIQSIIAGDNITVDDTDPANPIISASGGGGGGAVDSVNGQTGEVVLGAEDVGAVPTEGGGTITGSLHTTADLSSGNDISAGRDLNAARDVNVARNINFGGTINSQDFGAMVTKLDGIEEGATANDTDANLKNRANHTGTQAISTVSGLQTALDDKADDDEVVKLTGDQTVAGVKTFSSSPVVPTPTTDMQAATKKYVDDAIVGGGYTDEQAQDAVGGILTDSDEIDFTYDDDTPSITATIKTGSIDETKLDTSVNASLDLADSAVQPGDLAAVATSGDYGDLSNTPTLGTAAAADTGDFATAAQGSLADTAVQPSDLATVATSGSYNDLEDKPAIPSELVDLDTTVTGAQLDDIKNKIDGIEEGAEVNTVDSVNGQTGAVSLDADDVLPEQSGNSGKFLFTNGTTASWETVSGGGGVNLYPRTPSGRWLHAWAGGFVTNQPPVSGYVPIQIARSQSFDAAGLQVTTGDTSAQVHLALYDDNDGYPGSLIADFGIADLSTTGEKILTLGSPIALPAGLYWMLALTNNSTIRLPVTAHTTWGQPATLWHTGPVGANTTTYQGGFRTSDTTPPSTAPSSMSTDRYIIIGSLRAA